jgi:hypothetical protein
MLNNLYLNFYIWSKVGGYFYSNLSLKLEKLTGKILLSGLNYSFFEFKVIFNNKKSNFEA